MSAPEDNTGADAAHISSAGKTGGEKVSVVETEAVFPSCASQDAAVARRIADALPFRHKKARFVTADWSGRLPHGSGLPRFELRLHAPYRQCQPARRTRLCISPRAPRLGA